MIADLPVQPPVEPMLAKPLAAMPSGAAAAGLVFEPKWDGFRCLIYRSGNEAVIQGRLRAGPAADDGSWDLSYAFPEMVELVRRIPGGDLVLDGELVVIRGDRLDFGLLGSRLRPRKEAGGWKIRQLATDIPTSFVAFDLLASGSVDLRGAPFRQRRAQLVAQLAPAPAGIHITPQTEDAQLATLWFHRLPGAGLDGLIAKPADGAYEPGRRSMFKLKHRHTVDVVCAGWRPYSRPGPQGQPVVGSLLLGVHDSAGVLHMVGATSAFPNAMRAELAEKLAPLAIPPGGAHPWLGGPGRSPGTPSRWQSQRSTDWIPVAPVLVCEVAYDSLAEDRFRHVATFVRWRADRSPQSCTDDQLFRPEFLSIGQVLDSDPGEPADQ